MKKCETSSKSVEDNMVGTASLRVHMMTIKAKYIVMYTLILQNNFFKDMTSTLDCFVHHIAVRL